MRTSESQQDAELQTWLLYNLILPSSCPWTKAYARGRTRSISNTAKPVSGAGPASIGPEQQERGDAGAP